jgi:RNA polymerase sigma-70 factor (ECF subfamily)
MAVSRKEGWEPYIRSTPPDGLLFSRPIEIVSHSLLAAMRSPFRSVLTPARPFRAAAPPAEAPADTDRASALAESARTARFEQLYRDHADRVYGLCLRMSGDRATATELAQDVFVRAWQQLDRLRPDTAPGAWLWRLATNVVLNARRGERRRLARVAPVGDAASDLAPLERVDHRTPLPVRRLSLDAAIARLPERARRVYVLHDVEGYAHEEVAALLGVAAGTVRAHLHRARALLREALR